jgi:RND family efflux transporter MFP subunit
MKTKNRSFYQEETTKMRNNKLVDYENLIELLIFGITLILAVILSGCGSSKADGRQDGVIQGRPVKTMAVTAADSNQTRSFPGIVKAAREINLAFRVGGPLIEYDLKTGEKVRKGETIARIDPRDYEITIRKLTAELKAAEARLADAEKDFQRQENLLVENASSQARYDKTRMVLDTSRAGIESLKTDLAAAKNALADTRLTAPFNGVINHKFTENHETVSPGMPVVSLLDVSGLEVATAVPEDVVIRESDFSEISVSLDTFPGRRFGAHLKEVGRQTEIANQSYPLTASLDVPEGLSPAPGMAATVHIILQDAGRIDEGSYLPTAAVFADADGVPCVWRVDMRTLSTEKVKVETGSLKGEEILVRSGLASGDHVVSAGARFLLEGQQIRILDHNGGKAS